MKVIAYSLWGVDPMYTIGALRNADLAKKHYPDWTSIFYCAASVPSSVVDELSSKDNVIVRMMNEEGNKKSAIWRFFPAEEEGIELLISRDCDSRLSNREAIAVNEWIASGKDFHIMRDHPYHGGHPILAGMFGVRGLKLKGIKNAAEEFVKSKDQNYKAADQDFLASWVWPKLERGELSVIIHDPFFLKWSFPEEAKRGKENDGVWFVGQCFDENDVFNKNDVEVLGI
jgi:protein O-GlcNAc transferase